MTKNNELTNNGTPSDEDWQKWYAHKSNKEIWIEEQERNEAEAEAEHDAEIRAKNEAEAIKH